MADQRPPRHSIDIHPRNEEGDQVTDRRIDNVNIGPHPSRWRRFQRSVLVAVAFTLPVAAWGVAGDQPQGAYAAAPAAAVTRVVGAGQDSYAPVVDAVSPAVVTIHAEQRVQATQFRGTPFADDPLFREFFGDRFPRGEDVPERRAEGLGSGVIVRPDGYILTNHHVIDGADRITVELTDRRVLTATVVGSDAPSDLAVLKVDAAGLPTVPLADSDAVKVGDVVLAVGNPMGVGQTVTMGIVSAKGRATGLGDGSFEDFLQTDAPINRGNSGGALVNTTGELVGINSQILSPSGGNIGIGFAIPANMARHVMESLIADGRVHRGMLGVTVQGVTPDIAKSLSMENVRGALVSSVNDGGPADDAGLERGDVITAIDGRAVASSNDLRNAIAATRPGTSVTLTVLRDGKERTIAATLDELPSNSQANASTPRGDEDGGPLGLAVEPLTRERARSLGIEESQGLLVASVTSGSPAADAGFRRGDVIEEVNGSPVANASALRQAVTAGNRPALVLVRRGDQSIYLTLSPRA
jgi:Do/DeqQ family serine protease